MLFLFFLQIFNMYMLNLDFIFKTHLMYTFLSLELYAINKVASVKNYIILMLHIENKNNYFYHIFYLYIKKIFHSNVLVIIR